MQSNTSSERILELRGYPQAAGIDIAPMIHRRIRRQEKSMSNEMYDTREDIARRKPVCQKGKIVTLDFHAVAPKAGRVLDRNDVVDGMSQRCLLN